MWFVASLNRPARLADMLASIRAVGCSTPGLVMVGPDDELPISLPDGWRAIRRDAAQLSMPAALNLGFSLYPNEPWYGVLGDRHLVRTPSWDEKLVAAAGSSGIASCNDRWRWPTGRMVGATVLGGALVRAFGFLYLPFVNHCCGDDFWEEIGQRYNIWHRIEDVIVENPHPMQGNAEADATHQRSYGAIHQDIALWRKYRQSDEYRALLGRVESLIAPSPERVRNSVRLQRARARSLMICTPIARAPSWQYTVALIKTFRLLDRLGIRCDAEFVIGNSNLPKARNELVNRFLSSDFSDMLFIDDDMGWEPNDVVRLLASEHPLIAGVGRKRSAQPNDDPAVWCCLFPDGPLRPDEFGAIPVLGVGTAFMRIGRGVFERLIKAHPDWKRVPPDRPQVSPPQTAADHYYRFFRFDDDGTREINEDYGFCFAWRGLGGEVYIDPEIALTHVGEKEFSGRVSEILEPADADQQRAA